MTIGETLRHPSQQDGTFHHSTREETISAYPPLFSYRQLIDVPGLIFTGEGFVGQRPVMLWGSLGTAAIQTAVNVDHSIDTTVTLVFGNKDFGAPTRSWRINESNRGLLVSDIKFDAPSFHNPTGEVVEHVTTLPLKAEKQDPTTRKRVGSYTRDDIDIEEASVEETNDYNAAIKLLEDFTLLLTIPPREPEGNVIKLRRRSDDNLRKAA